MFPNVRSVYLILVSLLLLALPAAAQTINGCVAPNGNLRIILPGDTCKNNEFPISWSSAPVQSCVKSVAIGTIQVETNPATTIYETKTRVDQLTASGGGGGGTGKPEFAALEVVKSVDAGSADLYENVVVGSHLAKVKITINATANSPSAIFELENVLVTSYNVDLNECHDQLLEHVSFTYGKIKVTIGGNQFCWDLISNKKC